MSLWILLLGLALASPADDIEQRLLGDEPLIEVGGVLVESVETPWWPLPASALGIALLWGVRRQITQKTEAAPQTLRVTSRTQLGQGASLAVVEVHDDAGSVRRLLVGMGTGAAPNLVADLGIRAPGFSTQLAQKVIEEDQQSDLLIEQMLTRSTFQEQA